MKQKVVFILGLISVGCFQSENNDAEGPTRSPMCDFTYSQWSECEADSIMVRTVVSKSSSECSNEPILSQHCNYTAPSCLYTYTDWSTCKNNNTQERSVLSIIPTLCSGTPVLSRSCDFQPKELMSRDLEGYWKSNLTERQYYFHDFIVEIDTLKSDTTTSAMEHFVNGLAYQWYYFDSCQYKYDSTKIVADSVELFSKTNSNGIISTFEKAYHFDAEINAIYLLFTLENPSCIYFNDSLKRVEQTGSRQCSSIPSEKKIQKIIDREYYRFIDSTGVPYKKLCES